MTVLYLDTEFNDFGGPLISLALVANPSTYFYEVLPNSHYGRPSPWVAEHVIPVLNREPLRVQTFQSELRRFLNSFKDPVTIVADWPDDVRHLCAMLITGPGKRLTTPNLTFRLEFEHESMAAMSNVPHNALGDALALMRCAQKRTA